MQAHAQLAYTSDSVFLAMFDTRRFTSAAVMTMYRFLGFYVAGYGCTMVFTDTMKLLLGQHRPHFLTVCDPDWAAMGHPCGRELNVTANVIDTVICKGDEVKIRQVLLLREIAI